MRSTIHTLSNGLTVMFIDTQAFPSITTYLLVGAGSRYETPVNNGIAHFFEHIPFKGTKNYPTAYDISSTIEGFGGIFNAYTSKDHTVYWIKALKEHFPKMIDITGDMVLAPLLDPSEIEREKGVIVEEINMYEDMPSQRVSEILSEVMYPNHPLGMPIIGTKETVTSFTQETFTTYMKSHYHPNNAVLVVAGGLRMESKVESRKSKDSHDYHDLIEIIEEKFGGWKSADKPTFKKFTDVQSSARIRIQHKKTEQAHFAIGFPSFSFRDPRKHAVRILGTILGGGSASRLFIELRERRGLCYYVGAGDDARADSGSFEIQAGVPNNAQKLQEAVRLALAECVNVRDNGLRDGELARAKELIKGRLMIALEDSSKIAGFFGVRKLLQDEVTPPEEIIAELDRVTAGDVQQVAREIFQKDLLSCAVIGPFDQRDLQNKDLVF